MSGILLCDLSSIAFPIWHMSGSEPDPDHVSNATVARVRQLAADYDHVAVCCDSRRSFRREKFPSYKAQREAKPEALFEQIDRAKRILADDGYAVFEADGYEADDVIATCVATITKNTPAAAFTDGEASITIASSDKDLCQLISDGVSVYSPASNKYFNADEVVAKFGVQPGQMREWLALVGDASDNVKGCPSVGPKRASELLQKHGTIGKVMAAAFSNLPDVEVGMTPSVRKALRENSTTIDDAYELVGLHADAPVNVASILEHREPKRLTKEDEPVEHDQETGEVVEGTPVVPQDVPTASAPSPVQAPSKENGKATSTELAVAPPDWDKALEPRNPSQAVWFANRLFESRMFSGYGNPDAVLSTILLGRELGLGMMASLRGVHNVKGRHSLAADLMVALVLKSGKCEYFEPIEITATKATYRTKRVGRPEYKDTFEIDEARRAGLIKGDSNWEKWPKDMVKARVVARMARAIYPDICFGLYTPEEFE